MIRCRLLNIWWRWSIAWNRRRMDRLHERLFSCGEGEREIKERGN